MSWICVFNKAEYLNFAEPAILNTKKIVTFEHDNKQLDPLVQRHDDAVTLIRCEGGVVVRVPGTIEEVTALIAAQAVETLKEATADYVKKIAKLREEWKNKRKEPEEA